MNVTALDQADDAALDELLAFAAEPGRPRAATGAEYRAIVERDAVAWQGFVARSSDDERGRIRAAAQATISPAIGLDQVQLNAFFAPGAEDAFAAVLDAVEEWARARDAVHVTCHLGEPSEPVLEGWERAGFARIGERQRVTRAVTEADAQLPQPVVDGLEFVALSDRPEVEAEVEALWRSAHEDVPSELRFNADSVRPLREELGLGAGEEFPPLVLVALSPGGEVAGLVVGNAIGSAGATVGHRMTATARAWRGRGVARALKVELIRRAATQGVTLLVASNDDANAPMRAINDRLGYVVDYRLALLRRSVG